VPTGDKIEWFQLKFGALRQRPHPRRALRLQQSPDAHRHRRWSPPAGHRRSPAH